MHVNGSRASFARRAVVATLVLKFAAVAMLSGGLMGLGASPASAQTESKPAKGCYTIWWNTAWAQRCNSGGATATGEYHSWVHCSGVDGSKHIYHWRKKGNGTSISGKDCRHRVKNGWIEYNKDETK